MRLTFVLLLSGLAFAEPKPAGVPVGTWVREDIFAGFMTNDMVRFEAGMRKLDDLIAVNPDVPNVIAWRAGTKLFLSVRAYEAGRKEQFEKTYETAVADLARARKLSADSPNELSAVLAITGGVFTVFSDRLPEKLRKEGWTKVAENYAALRDVQKPFFDKLPLHMRGEVLSGLAQAAQRLGSPDADSLLGEVITTLPDSVYATRAKVWRDKPELAAKSSIACLTCHDAGRLQARMPKDLKVSVQ